MSKRFTDWLIDRHRGCVLLLLSAVLALYLPFWGNPLFFDDLPFLSGSASPEPWLQALQRVRGLPYNTLHWTWQWFGSDLPYPYRLGSAVLHAANAIALFFLLMSLTGLQLAPRDAQRRVWICLLGSLIFALHPVATYAVGYVVQRSILMATLFALLAQTSWIKAWTEGRLSQAGLSLLLYFLASFSKEHAVTLPAVMAAISLMLIERRRLPGGAIVASACVAVGIALAVYLRRGDAVGAAYEPMSAHVFAQAQVQLQMQASAWSLQLLSMATQALLFFRYCLLWLLPLPAWMAIDMRVEFFPTLADWRVWGALIAFCACALWALRLLREKGAAGLVGLAILAPMLLFAVEFSTVRIQEAFVLYRSYLWMPLLMLLPALLALRLSEGFAWVRTSSARWLLPAALVLGLSIATVNRLHVASDIYTLWDDAARMLDNDKVPGADRILYNRGQAALAGGQPAKAVSDIERVASISPGLWQVWQLLGAAHLSNAQPQLAQADFERALQLHPGDGALLFGRAIARRRNGEQELAMADLDASCQAKWMAACVVTAQMRLAGSVTGANGLGSGIKKSP